MNTSKKVNTNQRLIFSFCVLILIFFFYGFFTLIEHRTIFNLTRTLYNHPLAVSNAALQSNVSITKMHRNMKDVVLFKSPTRIQQSITAVGQQETIVYQSLDIIKDLILGDKGKTLEYETRALFDKWRPIRAEVIKLVNSGRIEEAANITVGKGADHVLKLEKKMFALTKYARTKASEFMSESENRYSRLKLTSILFLLLGIILSSLIAFFTLKKIQLAEKDLQDSERQLSSIYNTTSDSIFKLDVESDGEYRFKTVNEAFLTTTGLKAESVIGKCIKKVIPAESLDLVRSKYRQAIQEKTTIHWEETSDYPTGRRTALVSIVPIFDANGACQHLVGSVKDITKRKQSEEEVRKSKILLESSIESPKDMIILSLDREYRYFYFNETHVKSMAYVYNTQPKIGECIFDFMTGKNDIEKVKAHYDRAMAGDGHIALEEYGDEQAHGYFEIQYNPIYNRKNEIIGVTAFAQDITERKKTENELKMLSESIENALNGFDIVDAEGKLIYVNKSFAKMYGYESASELIGVSPVKLCDDPSLPVKVIKTLKEKGEYEFEHVAKRKNGTSFQVLMYARLAKDKNGKEIYPTTCIDITKRKKAEKQIKASLKEKEVLLKELYHRTKNNMQVIIAMINLQTQNIEDETILGIFKETNNRINSMALVHEKLYQAKNLSRINLKDYFIIETQYHFSFFVLYNSIYIIQIVS